MKRTSYLTTAGKFALLKVGAAAVGTLAATAFLVAPRKRDWKTTAQWKTIERFRYAHRGLYDQPPSAQTYPKGTANDPFKDSNDSFADVTDKIVQFTDKVITKSPNVSVPTPLWIDDVKDYPNLMPENSLPAFRAALEAGYGIECDVRLTKDNVLVAVHDSDLERLCGRAGFVEQLTHEQLLDYRLLGTEERIPTLDQVLSLFAEVTPVERRHAPIIVELKTTASNYADLTRLAMLTLDRYDVDYCIESFDTRVSWWLRRHRPDVFRGQLSENYMLDRGTEKYGLPLRLAQSSLLCNVMSRPDFVSYKFADRKSPFVTLARILGARLVTWTIRSDAELALSEREGAPAIFEYIRPEAHSRLSK